MPLSPDKKEVLNGLTVYDYNLYNHNPNKISMPSGKRKKTVAITIHNTGAINVASNTTPAEQYVRATQNGNMNSVRVHYYVDDVCAWRCMPDDYVNWSCADGTSNANSGNNTSVAIEVIGNSKKAEDNAVKLAAYLLNKYNLTVENGLRSHTYWLNVRDGKKGTIDYLNTAKHPYKWCLPIDSTELLTTNGWKSLKDITIEDQVAQFDNGVITFVNPQAIVTPYIAKTLKTRFLEATPDHRMLVQSRSNKNDQFFEKKWGEILDKTTSYIMNTAGQLDGSLDISDDELLLLTWIQGDGHYMKNNNNKVTGIEFHLKKERKINRICHILEELQINYSESWCNDGSVHIRIYDKSIYDWAETWLENKEFSYKMLPMSQEQFDLFLEELQIVDGCKNERQQMYTSFSKKSLDFVQALCATHNKRSSQCTLGTSKKYQDDQPVCVNFLKTKANFCRNDHIEERETLVSCVSVPSTYILIRQNNHTFIVGNCPVYILPHWSTFKANVKKSYDALAKPAESTTPAQKVEPAKYFRIRKDWEDAKSQIGAFTTLDNAIKKWQEGYFIFDWEGKVVYPEQEETKKEVIDATYCVYSRGKWNGDIVNWNDKDGSGFAGYAGSPINGIVAKAAKGQLVYKVHIKHGGWLSWIKKYEKNNWYNGCAGLKTQQIDAVQMSLEGLDGYQVRYRVSTIKNGFLPWVTGTEDYAGIIGNPIDKLQIEIIKL